MLLKYSPRSWYILILSLLSVLILLWFDWMVARGSYCDIMVPVMAPCVLVFSVFSFLSLSVIIEEYPAFFFTLLVSALI